MCDVVYTGKIGEIFKNEVLVSLWYDRNNQETIHLFPRDDFPASIRVSDTFRYDEKYHRVSMNPRNANREHENPADISLSLPEN